MLPAEPGTQNQSASRKPLHPNTLMVLFGPVSVITSLTSSGPGSSAVLRGSNFSTG
eukprot:CAMPEP_0180760146 /NCGR_PEP_ID=MMETSP1038_2-20121128/36166_1 /TAXON_ID=632150 /ORGANISM="Azadinium spinosum, Strain 3D9" /LENGTH=55 /DNA_ID=CAMNT_0022794291 /DNA_START=106 /DNA_END=269 /DNA_ORIENTATION=+